ncbi:MAG TPA: glycosyltransferase family 39 protein [Mycobacteriales bacterium]
MTALAPDVALESADLLARPLPRRRLLSEQIAVSAAQGFAGIGNFAFSLIALAVLPGLGFTHLADFLALLLLLNAPVGSLAAGGAVDRAFAGRVRRPALATAVVVGGGAAAAAGVLAPVLGLPRAYVLLLAAAAPGAALLPLARGRLYGRSDVRGVAASLVAEPAVRVTAGTALAVTAGPVAACAGVVGAGYAALAVTALAARRRSAPRAAAGQAGRGGTTVLTFLLLAVLQNLDLVLATRLLPPHQAAVFAAVSTVGGIAVFATMTLPLVLLPRAAAGERRAVPVAVGAALVIGVASVGVGALVPSVLPDDRLPRSLLVPYLAAMALLGLTRVLVAGRCAAGRGRAVLPLVAAGLAAQAALIVAFADTAAGVVGATLVATAAVTAGATVVELRRARHARSLFASLRSRSWALPLALAVIVAVGIALRLWVTRGIWVDEAISIREAREPFRGMLSDLSHTDVHPPGYFTVLWAWVHAFGSGPLSVRMPGILAGIATIPAVYAAGRDLFDRRTGLVAALFAALSPMCVWYAQEARPYAFFLLFSVLALWLQVRAVRRGGGWTWTGYVLSTAALLWSHYFALIPVAVQQLAFAVVIRRRHGSERRRIARGWAASLAAITALMVALVPFALHQLAGYGHRSSAELPAQAGAGASPGHTGLNVYSVLANGIYAVWGYHSDATMVLITALWPVLALLALLCLGRGRSGVGTLLGALVVVPVTALFLAGTFKQTNLFDLRYFIGIVPVLLIAAARMVTRWSPRRSVALAAAGLAVVSLVAGLVDQELNASNPRRYDFNHALSLVDRQFRPGDVIYYDPDYLRDVVRYYAPGRAVVYGGARRDVAVPAGHHAFVVASFLDQPGVAGATGTLLSSLEHHGHLVAKHSYANVTVWEFS